MSDCDWKFLLRLGQFSFLTVFFLFFFVSHSPIFQFFCNLSLSFLLLFSMSGEGIESLVSLLVHCSVVDICSRQEISAYDIL